MSDENLPLQKPPGYREPGLPPQNLPPPPQLRAANLPSSAFIPPKEPRRSCCHRCCCCFTISTILLGLFFISFGGFLYLYYKPKLPSFALESFQVRKLDVSGLELDSRIDMSIEFKNDNEKIKLVYDKMAMFLNGNGLKEDLDMGQDTIPGFIQGPKSAKVVRFTLRGNRKVSNADDAKKVKKQFRAKSLMMSMKLITAVGVELNGLSFGTVGVKVVCGAFSLKDIQNGANPNCDVFALDEAGVY